MSTKRTLQLLYPKQVDDKRKITAKMIDEIINNSGQGSRFPVAVGHLAAMGWFDDSKPAAGRFDNLRKDQDGFLLADVNLKPEVDDAYKAGDFPGWSVGIFKTEKDGWQMDHLALLGSVGAAFKDLQEVDSQAFSIVEHSGHSMTVECFSANNEDKKTLWLVQSAPKPAKVEQPAVNLKSEPQEKKGHEMDPKDFEAFKAEQDQKMAELRADNEKLKADNEARKTAEVQRLSSEFKSLKEMILNAAAEKGVTETARATLSTALDAYDAHYQGGIVNRELFDALTGVFKELKPRIQPGELTETPEDDFKLKSQWSGNEAIDALTN